MSLPLVVRRARVTLPLCHIEYVVADCLPAQLGGLAEVDLEGEGGLAVVGAGNGILVEARSIAVAGIARTRRRWLRSHHCPRHR